MSMLPLILTDVSLWRDGNTLIDGVSVTFSQGTKSIVLGHNGAGKSLLLRICHGLMGPDSGSVAWAQKSPEGQRRQAMVFQKPIMLRRSVRSNVTYGLKVNGVPKLRRQEIADMNLKRVGLADIASRPAAVLSGGEQQRLALARAWALAPDVLFLDEPTANLDPAATQSVEEIVEEIHGGGTKIIMTTHDLSQARRLADEVVFMHQGKMAEHAQADQFFDAPASSEARAYLNGELRW